MANKKGTDQELQELGSAEVRVSAKHVATPHGIELRREGTKKLVEVRTQDFESTETIGAKTIESILREAGAELPVGDAELIIRFSPHTGEVIDVVAPGTADEGSSSEEKSLPPADE